MFNIVQYICIDNYKRKTKKVNNKELQEQRMKYYFVQATKEIITAEGIKALSVRSIAEKAGYSFATLYNYFKDVKELIFYCVEEFAKECHDYVVNRAKVEERGIPKIKKIVKAYVEYMVQYPGVFDLFYLEKIAVDGTSVAASDKIVNFLDELCEEEIQYCVAKGTFRAGEGIEVMSSIRNSITGILVLYMNRQYPKSYYDFVVSVNRQLDNILD